VSLAPRSEMTGKNMKLERQKDILVVFGVMRLILMNPNRL
jgi:hypothetical protein